MSSQYFSPAATTGLSRLFGDAGSSDFTIRCQDETFPVHSAIIGLHGGYFAKITTADFKEKQEKAVDLKDEDPKVLRAVLQSLYSVEYKAPSDRPAAVFHAAVYAAAEYYQLPPLKGFAGDNFVDIAASTYINEIKDCLKAAPIIYNKTPESAKDLRQPLVEAVNRNFTTLFNDDLEHTVILSEAPRFATDLINNRAKWGAAGDPYIDPTYETKLRCQCCNELFILAGGNDQAQSLNGSSDVACPLCGIHNYLENYQNDLGAYDQIVRR